MILTTIVLSGALGLAARGESLAAFGAPNAAAALGTPFDGRCIPGGRVAPPSNTAGILSRRALPAGRLARLGATPDFRHGLLRKPCSRLCDEAGDLRSSSFARSSL